MNKKRLKFPDREGYWLIGQLDFSIHVAYSYLEKGKMVFCIVSDTDERFPVFTEKMCEDEKFEFIFLCEDYPFE